MKEKKDKLPSMKAVRDDFDRCKKAEDHNRVAALADLKFARLGEQWPNDIKSQREEDQRPCLTINKLPAFRRQVVNEARQNKPSIKVRPNDSDADPETAEIFNGLIRNIEAVSNAAVAYDTATECAVDCGFGYVRVGIDYAHDDAFDQDLNVMRVRNPFAIYGDPDSKAADSSDWNVAFVVEQMTKDAFKKKYPEAKATDFEGAEWQGDQKGDWIGNDHVMVAEYWVREEVDERVLMLSNGLIITEEQLAVRADTLSLVQTGALQVVKDRQRKAHKVKQYIVTGAEVLDARDWPGRYIPIVPVYGDEFDVEGKRYLRSLIHDSKDAQRNFNYWRSVATELVALAPRVPFIGPEGAFETDAARWETVNTHSHAYLEYDGNIPPQRQPLDTGPAGGALQEALNASDDMKAIMGLYDASLGARSNETSGRAIMARQREGDVSTFHFLDNMVRAIQHVGRILIDLIPHVYSEERIIRILGEDGKEKSVQIGPKQEEQKPQQMQQPGQPGVLPAQQEEDPIERIYDLTRGKYDLVVSSGPSYTTRREETAQQMMDLIQANPPLFPLIGDLLVNNLDWPDAEKIAQRLAAANGNGIPPELKQQIEAAQAEIEKLQKENAMLKTDRALKGREVEVKEFEAETNRIEALQKAPSGPMGI